MNLAQSLFFSPEEIVFGESAGRSIAARRGSTEYRAVNEVAEVALKALAEPQTLATLCTRLMEEFDIDRPGCEQALTPLLDALEQDGWIEGLNDEAPESAMRRRYLHLLKRALVNLLYAEHELRMRHLARLTPPVDPRMRERELRDIRWLQPEAHAALVRSKHCGGVMYGEPTRDAHTMVGLLRLDNLEYCARKVFADRIPGDFLEAGVCQGGAAIFLRALQVAFGEGDRVTWVADSFQGLPPPSLPQDTDMDFTESRFPWLAMSEATVKENFRTYDLLSDQVRFIAGWFEDSLPNTPTGPLALLRIDADLYKSTLDVLEALHERVSLGGYVIIDDYGAFAPCREATDEFRQRLGITAPLRRIDWSGVFWRKEK